MLSKLFSLSQMASKIWLEFLSFHLIRASGFFDEAWYLSNNPDVAQAKVNPLFHFVRHGGLEGRDPGPNFSSTYYLDKYIDVRVARINPLVHYLMYGKAAGREVHPKYKCPVCLKRITEFDPISTYYQENRSKYGSWGKTCFSILFDVTLIVS